MGIVKMPEILLAKSAQQGMPNKSETLVGHIDDVYQASSSITKNIGANILNSFGLDGSYFEQLRQALTLASCLHDLGKANDQFHRALTHQVLYPQALRHEWISTWLPLKFPELNRWLFDKCSQIVRNAVLFAVLGHHLKVESGKDIEPHQGSGSDKVTLFCDHPDFSSCLRLILPEAQSVNNPPSFPRVEINLIGRPLSELRFWLPEAVQWYKAINREERIFIALVKALLIASDVAGSAVPKMEINIAKWIESTLQRVCKEEDINTIAMKSLKKKPPRAFQVQVAESRSPIVFVKAGCGSGKTTAAYLWAAKHAKGRKLFFCYPTTGTATEGFRSYIPSEISADALLLHSRS